MTSETLDCGHPLDAGMPASVRQADGSIATVQGWQWVADGERRICHACADARVLECGHTPSPHVIASTGYGVDPVTGARSCYDCCSAKERESLIREGKGVLYLVASKTRLGGYEVTDWPGTLRFPVTARWQGRHNIARTVDYVRFKGPDGKDWSGRQYGDNSQICHVRRLAPAKAQKTARN